MGPLVLAGIGAGMGMVQGQQQDWQNRQQNKLNAEMMRYSPWTGMKPSTEINPTNNMTGSVAQGALSGASFGQNMQAADAQQNLMDAQTKYYQGMTPAPQPSVNVVQGQSPWPGMGMRQLMPAGYNPQPA